MNPPGYQVRRATLDDLPQLLPLWRTENLDVAALERRFTEFQVALDGEGKVVGGLGLFIDGTQGRLHSECFSDFALADKLRPLLWERLRTVARNRGLTRFWMREDTRYFRGEGFDPAGEEELANLPASFGGRDGQWWTFKLRDDVLAGLSPEQEAAIFKKLSEESTGKLLRQARVMKWVATLLAFAFFIAVVVAGYNVWRYRDYTRRYGVPPTYQPPPKKK